MNAAYLIRRSITAVGSLLAASTLIFLIVRLVPGDPVATMLGDSYNVETAAQLRKNLGLDLPIWHQYAIFLRRLFSGDLGTSLITHQRVVNEVVAVLPFTLQLSIAGLLTSLAIGVPAGIISAMRPRQFADTAAMLAAVTGMSMPSFWLGILLMILFAVRLGWLPLLGVGNVSDPFDLLRHLILPGVTLGLRGAGLVARVTRSALLETSKQDYVRTALAKGLSTRAAIFKHAFPNALLPVVTVAGLDLGRMLGGTTVVETVFSRPGMGLLLVEAVLNRDYPLIQGAFLFYLALIVVVNLLVDILYARLDPRIVYT